MTDARVTFALIDVTCALLDLDERLTDKCVPRETRARRLARAREVLSAWTAGTMTTEGAERELQALIAES